MYVALLIILLGAAMALIITGLQKMNLTKIVIGVLVAVFTVLFFALLSFWGEMLWFGALGYSQRFWDVVAAKVSFAFAGALFGWASVYLLTFTIPREKKQARIWSKALGTFIGGIWGFSNWDTILMYLNRISTEIKEPILGKNTGFYLFTLPFYDAIYTLFLLLSALALITVVISLFVRVRREGIDFEQSEESANSNERPQLSERRISGYLSLYVSAAAVLFVLAWGRYLSRFHLMYSTWGVVAGPGWTDVNIRLPTYTIIIALTAILGLVLVIPPIRRWLQNFLENLNINPERSPLFLLGTVGVITIGIWFLGLILIPRIVQWLRVEPNEITVEKPFIAHNINFTRQGFRLHEVEEREFPASETFTQQMVQNNQNLFSNIRLWDWRALDAVYKQFQEIRLYYEFKDVDIDRYTFANDYRQVMVSAREMELSNLPPQSQTFVNRRFKYTHGYGITLTTVNEFTSEGLPNLLVKDIPPKSQYPGLEVKQPQIYYGELTRSHAIANTKEQEFDYPSGEKNIYIRYPGDGGVALTNIWRKFLFGWKFDGTRFFLSSYPTAQSRIMFHRQIQERVKALAPFLQFDNDPYIVLANGKLYWIIDGYTTSKYYPYSEPFLSTEMIEYRNSNKDKVLYDFFDQNFSKSLISQVGYNLNKVNYIRNSVKVVVDAFSGSVNFYIFDADDAIIQVWDKVFPNLFKQKSEMPKELFAHVRYPIDMLLVQGLVYAKYHMSDPTVFYNQEDLWVRATEKYYNQIQPVEPYYIMWKSPGSDKLEYVLILPFTPKNRQVLIGWIAGMCDLENYGRFLAYKFPKEKRILGPQQVETKIDQDSFLSGQLTLWDQRGSNVIRGNVLAIPVEETLFYVEPIYLQAETAAYPELRLVVVMHEDNLSYAETFDKALHGLFEEGGREVPLGEEAITGISSEELIKKANDAFEDYLRFLGEKQFDEASQALETLQQTLQRLSELSAPVSASTTQ